MIGPSKEVRLAASRTHEISPLLGLIGSYLMRTLPLCGRNINLVACP